MLHLHAQLPQGVAQPVHLGLHLAVGMAAPLAGQGRLVPAPLGEMAVEEEGCRVEALGDLDRAHPFHLSVGTAPLWVTWFRKGCPLFARAR